LRIVKERAFRSEKMKKTVQQAIPAMRAAAWLLAPRPAPNKKAARHKSTLARLSTYPIRKKIQLVEVLPKIRTRC